MIKIKTLTAIAIFALATTVMAQESGRQPRRSFSERANMETQTLVKALELNADQTVKIEQINRTYAVKDSIRFSEMRKGDGGQVDRETMMKNMQAQRAAKAGEIKALLTDAQKEKYEAYLKENANRGPRQGGQGGQQN
jgi:hypothetical protein